MKAPHSGPWCSNCNYNLTGLTESSKCPECGRPLVEVLQRPEWQPPRFAGRRYTSPVQIFGLPLVQIAIGPDGNERYGRARGIIAYGDSAVGLLAIGGRTLGIISLGGVATGVVAFGGCAIGLLSFGGFALGILLAIGGAAVGGIAAGGGALGFVALGGGAIGYYARGGGVFAKFAASATRRDPQALAFFSDWQWLLGGPPGPLGANLTLFFWALLSVFVVALFTALPCLIAYLLITRRRDEGGFGHGTE